MPLAPEGRGYEVRPHEAVEVVSESLRPELGSYPRHFPWPALLAGAFFMVYAFARATYTRNRI
jgi:hypothetical protein